MAVNLEERHTAGKRVRVEHLWDGMWAGLDIDGSTKHGGLAVMIQVLANYGYNFAGKVDEFIPTGTIARPTADFLFIKAPE